MNSDTPYQSPGSDVIHSDSESATLNEIPNSCAAGAGWTWIKDAFTLFKANAGLLIGMILVYMVIMFAMGLVPLLGSLATVIVGPAFTGGFMIAARNMDQGQGNFNDMFAGFQNHFAQLCILGLIYFGFFIAFMAVIVVFGFGSALMGGDPAMMENPDVFGTQMILWMLIGMALFIPVLMGMWFAPSLIVFHQLSAWNAFTTSFKGCLKNIIPFLVFGVIGLLLMIPAIIPFGLGLLILVPTMMMTMYTGYKMIFLK
ncbi:MAG: hypothetical protein MI867_05310 [Pseudomonadales bacterium]|nr:hypothetical protein [Pseudomonadales bacterium]